MATTEPDPYLEHVPMMTGGSGREGVRRLCAPSWPDDVEAMPGWWSRARRR